VTRSERSWSSTGVTVSALVVVVACLLLGRWQLGRVYRPVDGYFAEPAAVPLGQLVPEHTPVTAGDVARQVTVTGVYDISGQLTQPGHLVDGQSVYWVVTPLVVSDSGRVPIVRGWVTRPGQSLAQPPAGAVTVTARLERGVVSAGGRRDWLAAGYLVRTAQSPPDPLSLQPVPVPPPKNQAATEFHLQNAVYVSQWWLLAAIVVVFWWRLVRSNPSPTSDLDPVGARVRADTTDRLGKV
jgi:cytochrome oxidase assembly protein ShyY1